MLDKAKSKLGYLSWDSLLIYIIVFILVLYSGYIIGRFQLISSDAFFVLIGTLIGALISAGVQWLSSTYSWRNQFKMAALEKRLAAHQEVYALWEDLIAASTYRTLSGSRKLFPNVRNGGIEIVSIWMRDLVEHFLKLLKMRVFINLVRSVVLIPKS